MIEDLKDKISQLEIDIQILEAVINYVSDLINKCISIDPQRELLEKDKDYSFKIDSFNSQRTYIVLQEYLDPFKNHFFNKTKFNYSINLERDYLKNIYHNFYGMLKTGEKPIIGIFGMYEKERINPNSNHIIPKEIKNYIDNILKFLSNLKYLKENELTKVSISITLIQKEIYLIDKLFSNLIKINHFISDILILEEINSFSTEVKNRIFSNINNNRIKKSTKEISNIMDNFLNSLDKRIILLGSIQSLKQIITLELEQSKGILIKDQTRFKDNIKRFQETEQRKEEKLKSQKLNEFKEIFDNDKNIAKVYKNAKDVKMAIKHSQIGRDNQIFFDKENSEDFITFQKPVQNKEESITNQSDINHWFKYGKNEKHDTEKIKSNDKTTSSNMKTTSFGTSLKDLLKDSGIDLSSLKNNFKDD